MTPEREAELRRLEERLGHPFRDLALLDRALTHSSRANEDPSPSSRDNEPLEFLGDAVLGFLVADLLHQHDPEGDEGMKTRMRARLVSSANLARRAVELGLDQLLMLGRGEERTGGRKKSALCVNAYEAVVAALYLDGGIEAARRFLFGEFGREIQGGGALAAADFKSALQEYVQGRGRPLPEYEVIGSEGPSHRPRFRVLCRVDGEPLSEGEGFSKKEAQQEAARGALEILRASEKSEEG